MATLETSKGGRPRDNSVRIYFVYNSEDGYNYCQIPECHKKVKGNHNGNLLNHLKVHHSEKHAIALRTKEGGVSSKRQRSKSVSLSVSITGEQIREACVELVTVNGRPFKLMDDSGFRKILEPLLKACEAEETITMSSATVRDLVVVRAEEIRDAIREEVKGKLISLKVDAATRHDRGFLGINVQFMENGIIQIRTLGTIELTEKHTAENLERVILSVLEVYNIQVSNIYTFTSDNGANMVKLAKLLEKAQSHCDVDSDEEDDTAESDTENEAESENNDSEDIELFEAEGNEALDESEFCQLSDGTALISNLRCAAHTLQLAVLDALKTVKGTQRIIGKARRVAKALRKPTNRKLLLSSNPQARKPKLDVSTRWNSTADMFESLLECKEFCVDFSSTYKNIKDLHLTNVEWQFIEDYLKSLMPAKIATVRLQEEQLTLGSFYGIWMRCKLTTAQISTPLAREVVKAMERREPQLMQNDALLASVFLDPRYLSVFPAEYHDQAMDKLEQVWKKLEELADNSDPLQVNLSSTSESSLYTRPGQMSNIYPELNDDVFRQWVEKGNSTRVLKSHAGPNIRRLLEEYRDTAVLDLSGDVLQFWERKKTSMPQLYRLATVVHAAPATQVSVERLFSAMAYILSSLRTNLTSAILDDILVVRCNENYGKKTGSGQQTGKGRHQRRRTENGSLSSGSSDTSTPIDEQSYATLIARFNSYEASDENCDLSHTLPYDKY